MDLLSPQPTVIVDLISSYFTMTDFLMFGCTSKSFKEFFIENQDRFWRATLFRHRQLLPDATHVDGVYRLLSSSPLATTPTLRRWAFLTTLLVGEQDQRTYRCCGLCKRFFYGGYDYDVACFSLRRPFLACYVCENGKTWNKSEAQKIWGFTITQLKSVPYWHFQGAIVYSTPDLIDYRYKFPFAKRGSMGTNRKEASMSHRKRYVQDLPEIVKSYVKLVNDEDNQADLLDFLDAIGTAESKYIYGLQNKISKHFEYDAVSAERAFGMTWDVRSAISSKTQAARRRRAAVKNGVQQDGGGGKRVKIEDL
jgi:hypothetical protein